MIDKLKALIEEQNSRHNEACRLYNQVEDKLFEMAHACPKMFQVERVRSYHCLMYFRPTGSSWWRGLTLEVIVRSDSIEINGRLVQTYEAAEALILEIVSTWCRVNKIRELRCR